MTERVVTAGDGTRMHTRVDGDPDAPVLLLINSLGCDLTMWDPQVAHWTASQRVIRYDQRGHGRTDAPPGPYTVAQMGTDALAVLNAHTDQPADICGLSLGGLVALWMAATSPHRVHRLVLADTAIRIGTADGWHGRAATVRAHGMDPVIELVLDRFFSPAVRASGRPTVAGVADSLRTTSPEGYASACDALAQADLTRLAPNANAPTLVVVGTRDIATPPDDARRLCELLPDATLVQIPDAGHLANLEQPEQFTHLVDEFLTRTRPATTPE